MGIVQNVIGSTPIINIQPPPEGQHALTIQYQITGIVPMITEFYQLNALGSFALSQVCTLLIDNSLNLYPIAIIHGALNTLTNVQAGGQTIVPTFSNNGPYAIQIAAAGNITPASTLTVNITFMNYFVPSSSFTNAPLNSVVVTGLNSTLLYSSFNTITNLLLAVSAGNYVLTELEMFVENIVPVSTGLTAAYISVGTFLNSVFNPIASMRPGFNATGTAAVAGSQISAPVNLQWGNGFLLPRGAAIYWGLTSSTNISTVVGRLNLYGYNTP